MLRRRRRSLVTLTTSLAAAVLMGCTSSAGDPASTGDVSSGPAATTGAPAESSTAPVTTSSGPSGPAQAAMGRPTVLASGLDVPWGVAFLPDGTALVSERQSHRIVRVTAAGAVTTVGTVPGVAADAGEGGLLGLALSPSFPADGLVYAYLTSDSDNRVVRMRYTGTALGAPVPVFTGIPAASNHDGGRIAFGPDGFLYVTAGDANRSERAPDRAYLGGKVLRMTADGRPAPGNPDPASVVYTVGHRNPQGLAWTPDGRLYEAEFGQNALDEINLLQAGHDYGWPVDEGTNGPDRPGVTRPVLTWRTDDASPSGLAYAGGSLWLATLRGERLYRIPVLAEGALGRPVALVQGDYGRLRTVLEAPDGSLWLTTSNRDGRGEPSTADDRIIRIPLG